MAEDAITVHGLCADYGAGNVLSDVSFGLPPGHRLAVLGRNGAGKTTLCAAIMGLHPVSGGQITLFGQRVDGLPPHARARAGLGLVRQGRHVFPSLTVEENLRAVGGRVAEAYALFPPLSALKRQRAGQLSGGEQQMLAIARTLLLEPRVCLLDEPLEGLAPTLRKSVLEGFAAKATADGLTVVLAEQDVSAALAFADQALVLVNGRAVWFGEAAALSRSPDRLADWVGVSPGA